MKSRLTPQLTGQTARRLAAVAAVTPLALLLSGAIVQPAFSQLSAPTDSPLRAATGRDGKITTEFRFTFDRQESLRPGTQVRDVTGHHNHGTVQTSGSGHLRRVAGISGKAAKFPCRGCGRALIEVPDARFLDPGRHAFWFGTAMKVTDRQTTPGKDPNLMQKGLIHQSGGRWKLELIGSRPQCTVTGAGGTVVARSSRSLDDGGWHRLLCRRDKGAISLFIDGVLDITKVGFTGRISNPAPVRIGGKAVGAAGSDDQYHGKLDSVFLKIDRR